jgi:hypothetical protein
MSVKSLIGVTILVFLVGCMSSPVKQDDTRECVRNFSQQEGIRNYRTTVTLSGVDKKVAITRLVRELGRRGFSVNTNDQAKGYVSATFDAGKSDLQLSAFFENLGRNSKVEMNYKGTGSGVFAMLFVQESSYMDELCSFAEAMKNR